MAVKILIICLCLLFNGLFAAYEMAFVSLSKADLKSLAKNENIQSKTLLRLRESPERTLSIIQVGITLVGALSAAVGGAGANESFEPYLKTQWGLSDGASNLLAIALVVVPLAFLNVVVGELVPKSLALRNPVKLALWGARFVYFLDGLFAPLVGLLEWCTKKILALFFPKHGGFEKGVEGMVDIESLDHHHQQAVLNLAYLENKKVKDIYIKWSQVNFIKTSDSMGDVVLMIFASGHTRLPVVDAQDGDIRGVLHTKEALGLRETGNPKWQMLIRPIIQVQLADTILTVLRLMQKNHSHMAVLETPDKNPLGLVTLEDISEEIWGDIFDEDENSRIKKIFLERVKLKNLLKG